MKYRYLINIHIAFDEIKSDQSIPTNKPKISNYPHTNRCCINIVESNHVIQILLCNKSNYLKICLLSYTVCIMFYKGKYLLYKCAMLFPKSIIQPFDAKNNSTENQLATNYSCSISM